MQRWLSRVYAKLAFGSSAWEEEDDRMLVEAVRTQVSGACPTLGLIIKNRIIIIGFRVIPLEFRIVEARVIAP